MAAFFNAGSQHFSLNNSGHLHAQQKSIRLSLKLNS